MKKKSRTKKTYRVLRDCHNNTNGKSFVVGDIVKTGDFPAAVITNFVSKRVLREVV